MHWRGRGDTPQSETALSTVNLRRIVEFLLPHWRRFLLVLFTVAAGAGLGVVPPILVRGIIDDAIGVGDQGLLTVLALAVLGVAVLSGGVSVLQSYLNTVVSQRIMYDLKVRMFSRLHAQSLKFFTEHRTGEMMSRLTSDINGIDNVISGTMVSMLSNVLIIATTVTAMLAMSWELTVLSLVILPWLIVPTISVGRLRRRLRRQRQQLNADVNAHMAETLGISGFLLVKAFAREREEARRFDRGARQLMDLQVREALVGRGFFMLLALVTTGGPALLYWYGGSQVIGGALTIGTVVAFVALLNRLYGPATGLLSLHVDVMTSAAYFERIFQYLDLVPDVREAEGAAPLPPMRGRITMEDVSLEYVPGQRAINGLSVDILPGQVVALVGPSGAGKTSLTYLVPRLYDPTGGRVLIDGQDIRGVTLHSLRSQVGMVTQETFLFHASVRDNLLFARPDATQEQLDAACRAAYLEELIGRLPEGYDTMVGERGHRLSGGEKQRLAIARVVLKDPRIFLLDEATSSLDTHSERYIQAAVAPLMAGRTSIVIAHRLSTILAADLILYMERGRILERGAHQELLAMNGAYARLYQQQFAPQELHGLPAGE